VATSSAADAPAPIPRARPRTRRPADGRGRAHGPAVIWRSSPHARLDPGSGWCGFRHAEGPVARAILGVSSYRSYPLQMPAVLDSSW